MVAAPAAVPVTIPAVSSIVATPTSLLLQVPPSGRSVSVIVAPAHRLAPLIASGKELTVTTVVAGQPPLYS